MFRFARIAAPALAAAVFVLPLASQAPALAQGLGATAAPGEWVETEGGRVRLLLGNADPDGRVDGAIEIELLPGWKTYWIAPGPAGIPPEFTDKGSRNVSMTGIEHPAPYGFQDAYGRATGYKDDVAFPVAFALDDPSAPARLRLEGFLGICDEICIPVPVAFEGDVVSGRSTPFETARLLREARVALPVEGAEGALEVRLEDGSLRLTGPALDGASEVFVAPPGTLALGGGRPGTGGWTFPVERGEGAGETVVVVRAGEGFAARETIHRPTLEPPAR